MRPLDQFKAGLHSQPGGVSSTPTSKFGDPDPGADVTSAWLELTLLSQCYGTFQEGKYVNMLMEEIFSPGPFILPLTAI